MKIGILPVDQVPREVILELAQALPKIFPDSTCSVIEETLSVPPEAYVKERKQCNSSLILREIWAFQLTSHSFDRVLGVINKDVFAAGLNFIFGEAYSPGAAALISLRRLKPSFYGKTDDPKVFADRVLKEAVHELGHTLGLQHCRRTACVMRFSNSILDTDKKESLFCQQHYLQASQAIEHLREKR